MKLRQWLYGAAALSMLGACSDRDVAPGNGMLPDDASGYVGVHIQLPTVPTTRANDSFDDGDPKEYKLNDAVLVLFTCPAGRPSTEATCVGGFELKRSQLNADKDDEHNQITTQLTRVAAVTGLEIDETSDLYALVIANGAGYKMYPDDEYFPEWMQTADKSRGKTIQEFQSTVLDNALVSQVVPGNGYASSIVMTNAPLTDVKVGPDANVAGTLPVLVKLNSTLYKTEAEALANPAGTVHIERAVGKVTCSKINEDTEVSIMIDGKAYDLKVDLANVQWDMAQAMNETYIVRNTNLKPVANPSGANLWEWNYVSSKIAAGAFATQEEKYRMVGHTPIINTYYRPYFCQVPGYGVATDGKRHHELKNFNKTVMNYGEGVKWDNASAWYPRENTFPVEYMKYANTTRIGFWMNFRFVDPDNKEQEAPASYTMKDGVKVYNDFYTKGLDKSTIYFNDSKGCDPLTAEVLASLKENAKVKEAVEAAMDQSKGSYSNLYLGDLLDFEYDQAAKDKDGEIVITSISFKNLEALNAATGNLFTKEPKYEFTGTLLATLNRLDQVYEYTGGKVFYEVRVKHFGDDLTPWDGDALQSAGNIEESYGTQAAARANDFLGRYGIVRNNWYDLNVEVISKLGDPRDPAAWDGSWPGKPDDNKDEYISVIVRVLSWAKRTQSVKF